jgi:hypothetical protein
MLHDCEMQTTLIFVQSLRGAMISILVFDEFVGVVALAEQERFATIVARYERLRVQMSEAER